MYDPFNSMASICALTSLIESGKRYREKAIAEGLLDITPVGVAVRAVSFDDGLREYARRLKVTADYHNLGLLTANQCGLPVRMMLINGEIFINPIIMDKCKKQSKRPVRCKTCASGTMGWYSNWILLSWQNLDGVSQTKKIADISCPLIQHGIYHLTK